MSDDRFVRACPRHLAPLTELWCPRGHQVRRWLTVDRARARVLSAADVDGPKEELHMPLPKEPPKKHTKQTLARAKFTRGATTLWLYLLDTAREGAPDRYRLRWNKLTGSAKKGKGCRSETGVSDLLDADARARAAFDKACKAATSAGWESVPVGVGRRGLVLKPIPLQ